MGHATGGVEAWGDLERNVLGADGAIGEVDAAQQGAQSGAGGEREGRQTLLDDVAVFVAQRHEIGDGAEGGELQERRVIGVAEMGQQGRGELVGDTRAAQLGKRVLVAGHPGVDDGHCVRELRRWDVVIGYNDVGSTPVGQGDFGGIADARVDGDDE